ncbi:hypothetical protein ACF3OB_07215 [Capnocytophaga canis]|uniref:hypothetical protein n=1 Tax=Capnocytophaga canis TaxID=1848903 RepID=UPI00370D0026
MKSFFCFFGFGVLFLLACVGNKDITQEQEEQIINNLFLEIIQIASNESCEDGSQWDFAPIGSKACGGPMGYIAYPKNIDVEAFLKKVAKYTQKQREFDQKWGIGSDCSIPARPKSVDCEGGKPIFRYDATSVKH